MSNSFSKLHHQRVGSLELLRDLLKICLCTEKGWYTSRMIVYTYYVSYSIYSQLIHFSIGSNINVPVTTTVCNVPMRHWNMIMTLCSWFLYRFPTHYNKIILTWLDTHTHTHKTEMKTMKMDGAVDLYHASCTKIMKSFPDSNWCLFVTQRMWNWYYW